MDSKWHTRFANLAKHVARWSKDPSTKVGAVIVDDARIIKGIGYNGFPRGVSDDINHYNDRPVKYERVVHAEANAILNAHTDLRGCTLYVWPLPTCNECAKLIIQSGIKEVICACDKNVPGITTTGFDWDDKFKPAKEMYAQAGINLTLMEV